ncbi:hypothetical protein JOB18_036585 [Solea senegalensis]|uniref:Uncharacterized protein n=1 Tax=Solea senegalensis TaxID=28829 RepID=A0AAV6RTX6_SOLSE|nr:hypothetical protein JOB18_036585 [Solea senegalensis]
MIHNVTLTDLFSISSSSFSAFHANHIIVIVAAARDRTAEPDTEQVPSGIILTELNFDSSRTDWRSRRRRCGRSRIQHLGQRRAGASASRSAGEECAQSGHEPSASTQPGHGARSAAASVSGVAVMDFAFSSVMAAHSETERAGQDARETEP